MPVFTEWESFYVIVGSSGAALTGLQFVVIALTVDVQRRSSPRTIDAFATPTIVHFCAALLVAGVLTAPWHSLGAAALALTPIGAIGVGYAMLIARRARHQTDYQPVFEDWLFHVGLPFAAYAIIALGAALLRGRPEIALFWIAAATITLLFIGIHNAWDTVTYLALSGRKAEGGTESPPPAGNRA